MVLPQLYGEYGFYRILYGQEFYPKEWREYTDNSRTQTRDLADLCGLHI